jgi:putative proteasome-type protease
MDSTIKANATVGAPVEILVYETDSFASDHYIKLGEEDPYLLEIRRGWTEAIQSAFSRLPLFEWEKRSAPTLQAITDERKP